MKNVVIVHGKPTEERYNNPSLPKPHEANWLPWLGMRLEEVGVSSSILAMPRPFYPEYEAWKAVFETQQVGTDSGAVGHSAGSEFLLRWLSENKKANLAKVALVAPYRDAAGKYGDFSQYELDASLTARVGELIIISSLDDSETIQKNAHRLSETLPRSRLIELEGYGHFMLGNNMKGPEFPELLDELVA